MEIRMKQQIEAIREASCKALAEAKGRQEWKRCGSGSLGKKES